MRATTRTLWILGLITLLILPLAGQAELPSISGKQDIQALYEQAQSTYDLDYEDAVYLFNGRMEQWLPDGRLRTLVHQIVWINGDNAQDHFGDNRIPYDKAHRDLSVAALRTWRLGRDDPWNKWWEHGETSVVETLPFALAKAVDYTGLRETMLLVNGIELPCIVEIAYIIEDREPYRKGAEGVWTFSSREPTLISWFRLGVPVGQKTMVSVSEGVGQPKKELDKNRGLDIYTWELAPAKRLGRPIGADPAASAPHIAWSTWKTWESYGNYLKRQFEKGMILDDALKDSLNKVLQGSNTLLDKVVRITDFVNSKTRLIHYDENYWWTDVRPAYRTFNTAYGHGLDRAVLAAALLKEAGLMVWPCYFGKEYGKVNEGVPTIGRMGDLKVWISGDDLEAYYDPSNGKVSMGFSPIYGRSVWLPGSEDVPTIRYSGEGEYSVQTLNLDLKYCPKKNLLHGSGFYQANGGFCGYHEMRGSGDRTEKYLQSAVAGVLPEVELTSYNPVDFDPISVAMNMELKSAMPEKDAFGRMVLNLDEAAHGISDQMPGNLHLYQVDRTSPVILWGKMEENLRIAVDLGELEAVKIPETTTFENSAGKFTLTVAFDNGKLILARKLKLSKSHYLAGDWKDLRSLLLTAEEEKNCKLYLK